MHAIEQQHLPAGHFLKWIVVEQRTRQSIRPVWDGRVPVGLEPDPNSPPVEVVHVIGWGSSEKIALNVAENRTP